MSAAHRERLRTAYARIAREHGDWPDWAAPLVAPIPFVGDHYAEDPDAPRLLVYASAENLITSKRLAAPWFDDASLARDRHRFTWTRGWSDVAPGTRIGVAPYEDGPLLEAADRLWRWERDAGRAARPVPEQPAALTEHVAVANFSKFALSPERANDDVDDEARLRDSLPYVQADLDLLRPSVVLLAKTLSAALTAEVAQFAARRGALLVVMPQASGQGPLHAPAHLARMRHPEAVADLAPLRSLAGKPRTGGAWPAWFALLRARYDAAATCLRAAESFSDGTGASRRAGLEAQ